MDKSIIKSEIEATRRKLAALQVLAGEDEDEDEKEKATEKEAGKADMIKCPDCGSKVLKATSYCLKCKKKIKGGDTKKDDVKKDDKKDDKKDSDKKKKEKEAAAKVAESLDQIAGLLESQNDPELTKLAYELDRVSDVLEGRKEASTLESDSDEPYMKQFFHAGARETDSDEPYMKEYNTDTSTELKDKFQKKQLGKDASSFPYQIAK
jgi:DNA-directed RNA polymerase subunit RPC12/RpoP